MITDRRSFLRNAGAATLLAGPSLATIATAMNGFSAHAADTSGYKALVCIFLLGGMDGHDVLIPYDPTSYDQFANLRRNLIDQYGGQRDRTNLLPLSPQNAGQFAGRDFALPPEMPNLYGLFQDGNAAMVANVGPLIRPLNSTQFKAQSVPVPSRLFSHNDQQSTWQSNAPEGSSFGWGGLFADAALAAGANATPEFTAITTAGAELFLTGNEAQAFQVSSKGTASEIEPIRSLARRNRLSETQERRLASLRRLFGSEDFSSNHLIERDIANAMNRSLRTNGLYKEAVETATPLATSFPESRLGAQLRVVAQTISLRSQLGVNRQVFFVATGGFDTHSDQAAQLPDLLGGLDSAIGSFYSALSEIGMQNNVTLFTASDFGRTLAINGDGTDHGWGGHHFVVGGDVNGRNIFGTVPEPTMEHEFNTGNGRLIPTTSTEQFAEPLGRWFGLNDAELDVALPNRGSFTTPPSVFV